MNDAGDYEAVRPKLFGIAYRMTGSVADAEDLCQECWVRWQRRDRGDVVSPEAFLVRTITNLAVDRLQSAQRRRESYVGPYLPEPLFAESGVTGDPAHAAELAESLTLAFLVMLDELTPVERAVLLLHDVFGYPFDEVGAAVGRSPDACRQVATRTRRKLEHDRGELRRPISSDERAMVERLVATTASGDVEQLMELLAPEVVVLTDAGRDRHAARNPVVGPHRVARLLVNVAKRIPATTQSRITQVNGELGLVLVVDGMVDSVITFSFDDRGLARGIYAQLNPEKLHHLTLEQPSSR
jgi:RNA polymerase sigma-70 factor (ECF subfamily)